MSIVLVLAGVAVILSGELTARGILGINDMMGLRFGYLRRSDEAWLVGHRAARLWVDAGGTLLVVVGLACLAFPLEEGTVGITVGVAMAVLVALVGYGAFVGNRAAREVFLDSLDSVNPADSGSATG